MRAVRERRKLKDMMAELLRAGLSPSARPHVDGVLPKKLPVVNVRPAAPPSKGQEDTQEWCDWLKEADLQTEVEQFEKAS